MQPARWFAAVAPVDLRCGADGLLAMVQSAFGRDAFDGSAYVFRNRSGTRLKLLLGDATGVWLCVRRLHAGSFVWPREGDALCELSSEQFAWLCAGVDWRRLSASKPLAKTV